MRDSKRAAIFGERRRTSDESSAVRAQPAPSPATTIPAVPLERSVSASPAPAITWRSVTLGLAGVVVICGLTPYNDYALNNTFMVGNNLPLGVVMLLFIMAVCVNAPL